MLVVLVVVALGAALALGVVIHHRRESLDLDVYGGMKVDHLVASVFTLAIIPCAFVLAITYEAFDDAAAEAGTQAGIVDAMFESAAFLTDRDLARSVQEDLVCYARAVRVDEWPRLATANPASPQVGVWTDRLQADLRRADPEDPVVAELRVADQARAEARRVVLTRATSGVPGVLVVLLVIDCFVAVLFTTGYTVRGMRWGIRGPLFVTLAVVLAGTLLVIIDLDRPYGGLASIEPAAMARTEAASVRDFATSWPGSDVSACDEGGRPVD